MPLLGTEHCAIEALGAGKPAQTPASKGIRTGEKQKPGVQTSHAELL